VKDRPAGRGRAAPVSASTAVLPIIAAYSPIERIWLRRHLPEDTIRKHDAMAGDDEEHAERVADDLLNVDERATEREKT